MAIAVSPMTIGPQGAQEMIQVANTCQTY